jgi:hypothetical protein
MNIAWLLAENIVLAPNVDTQQLKDLAPIWGSWRTQRGFGTDNVICHDRDQAHRLIKQGIASVCNLFVHDSVYKELQTPANIRAYGGNFLQQVSSMDDIVTMHLASHINTVLLLLGFDFSNNQKEIAARKNYLGLASEIIKQTPKCQWVLVDHDSKLDESFEKLENVTTDSFENCVKLLAK